MHSCRSDSEPLLRTRRLQASILILDVVGGVHDAGVGDRDDPVVGLHVEEVDAVKGGPLVGIGEDGREVLMVRAQRGDRLLLGDEPPESLPRKHAVSQKLPVGEWRDVRTEEMDFAATLGEPVCNGEHVIGVV